jgi:hypothetical protein
MMFKNFMICNYLQYNLNSFTHSGNLHQFSCVSGREVVFCLRIEPHDKSRNTINAHLCLPAVTPAVTMICYKLQPAVVLPNSTQYPVRQNSKLP